MKNVVFTQERKLLMSKIAKLRNKNLELREHLSKICGTKLTLYNKDYTVNSKYFSISEMSKVYNCCRKTISKCMKNNTIFKDIGIIKKES